MSEQITLFPGSVYQQSVTLVPLPSNPGLRGLEFGIYDTVAGVASPFTKQMQTQERPGGELITAKATCPDMLGRIFAPWKAWLMEMRGMSCAVQLSDPDALAPMGIASQATGTPLCDTSIATNNAAMSKTLVTRGWRANQFRLLLPGDALQIGYRMHYVMAGSGPVNSDANGAASILIWPSLREQPPDGTPLIFNHPKVLMRLAKNQRGWSRDVAGYSQLSFDLQEFR